MKSVAVGVRGGKGRGSRRAVCWAAKNLFPQADRIILVHVMPSITSIPTPSGSHIPMEQLDLKVAAVFVEDLRVKMHEEIISCFKKQCATGEVEVVVLKDDDIASALLQYISTANISSFVMGSCSKGILSQLCWKPKSPTVPSMVLNHAPDSCDIYIVSTRRIISKWAKLINNNGEWKQSSHSDSSRVDSIVEKATPTSSIASLGSKNCQTLTHEGSWTSISASKEQSDVQTEIERVRLQVQNTSIKYGQACEELAQAQYKVELLSSKCREHAKRVCAARKREETLREIASQEKDKYLEAIREIDTAQNLLRKEAIERQIAELIALQESSEKQTIADELFSCGKRYKVYTRNEIEVATEYFSLSNIIGEGAYGKVYRCKIDYTRVAIKVLRSDAPNKKDEFLKEVEILSHLHHPHVLLLLGACPEVGCLVYEYMENESLEQCLFRNDGKPPLPWSVRFRIAFELACGLAFLHGSKPEPIVHRDLKPGNILLDKHFVSKIGDVGLARLVSDVVPDGITEYRETMIAGTMWYIDPEYQRTGTLRPKSDLYALGVILLQLLTARHPSKLIVAVESAIATGSLLVVLDKSVTNWPLAETEELAHIALRCSQLKCRDRPDLETEVLPVLKRLADLADASKMVKGVNVFAPNLYFCPILQEVMDDPHIAADGFTYELRAIQTWLERCDMSPVTKRRLEHTTLTPNYTLRSAIQEWRSRMACSEK